MTEHNPDESDFDRLSREFRKSAGALEFLVDAVQDGIELEAFRDTSAGKILIGTSVRGARAALDLILDPNLPGDVIERAIADLRVHHRVLNMIAETIKVGRDATRRINLADQDLQEDVEL